MTRGSTTPIPAGAAIRSTEWGVFLIAEGEARPFLIVRTVADTRTADGWIFGVEGDRGQMLIRENRHGQFTAFLGVDGLFRAEGVAYGDGVGEWKEE